MCGIAGFVGWKKSYNNAITTLNKMKETIKASFFGQYSIPPKSKIDVITISPFYNHN